MSEDSILKGEELMINLVENVRWSAHSLSAIPTWLGIQKNLTILLSIVIIERRAELTFEVPSTGDFQPIEFQGNTFGQS